MTSFKMIVRVDCAVLHIVHACCSYINTSSQRETSLRLVLKRLDKWLPGSNRLQTTILPYFREGGIGLLTYSLGFPLELGEWLKESYTGTNSFTVGFYFLVKEVMGLPWRLTGKESTCQGRRCKFNPWVGKTPWRRNGNPLQYPCLGNSMNRGASGATFQWVAEELTRLGYCTTTKQQGPTV